MSLLDLNTLISKTAIDPEMARVRASMRREERDTAPKGYRPAIRQAINPLGTSLRRRPNYRTNRLEQKTDRDITFRSLRHNEIAIRRKNRLAAGDAERYRAES